MTRERMMAAVLSVAALALAVQLPAQAVPETDGGIHVARYRGDRKAAVSYTFDDALQEHYTVLYPQLRKRDIKATFWVNGNTVNLKEQGEKPRTTWAQLREMSDAGQEISNHGWAHRNLTKLTGEELRYEVQHNDTVIWQHTGVMPRTFCYPGNSMDSRTITYASEGRVGTRTEQLAVGGHSTRESLREWVDGLLREGKWGVGMTHGINYGYDAFTDAQILWDHLDYAFSLKGELWIATFHDVAAYIAERDNVKLSVRREGDVVYVKPTMTLDAGLYNVPLTLVVPNSNDNLITATQDGKGIKGERLDGRTLFDFSPAGGEVKIYMSMPATPPEDVTADMNYYQMLNQLGVKLPVLVAMEADPMRQENIYPMVEKPGRWKAPGGDERRRTNWGLWTNYEDATYGLFAGADSARVGQYTPIDLLKDSRGRSIRTARQWNRQRPVLLQAVQENMLGVMPERKEWPAVTFRSETSRGEAEGYAYVQQTITGTADCSAHPALKHAPAVECILRTPADAKGPVPVMIVLSGAYSLNAYWKIMAEQGWGVCIYDYSAVQPDSGDALNDYLIGYFTRGNWRAPEDIGVLGAWVWGVENVVDYLLTQSASVRADAIGVTGHSRCGKAALYAMALDERIAIAFPSDAGCMGTAMNRRHFGEDIELISPYWFAGNLMKYCGPLHEGGYLPRKVENMPVDAHTVLALCAPRPVFINSGTISLWADAYGMFLTAKGATPVYELLGEKGLDTTDRTPEVDKAYVGGTIGYRYHEGGHTDLPDWPAFFEFAGKFIK